MQPDTQMLGEVVVKGHVPQFQMGSEGFVTNVTNTPLSQIGTADDVLKHVPGIIAKDGVYEVFGKGSPIIYINGRKMRNKKELEQLKSTDIKSVELITNPGAKYDATVGAIVKIQTIRRAGDGFSIDTWGRWRQGHKAQKSASLDMNYRHNGLDIFTAKGSICNSRHSRKKYRAIRYGSKRMRCRRILSTVNIALKAVSTTC